MHIIAPRCPVIDSHQLCRNLSLPCESDWISFTRQLTSARSGQKSIRCACGVWDIRVCPMRLYGSFIVSIDRIDDYRSNRRYSFISIPSIGNGNNLYHANSIKPLKQNLSEAVSTFSAEELKDFAASLSAKHWKQYNTKQCESIALTWWLHCIGWQDFWAFWDINKGDMRDKKPSIK